jgi:hypothetical protein
MPNTLPSFGPSSVRSDSQLLNPESLRLGAIYPTSDLVKAADLPKGLSIDLARPFIRRIVDVNGQWYTPYVRYTGVKRCPRKNEWFLSGAEIAGYRAGDDLDSKYHIGVLQFFRVEQITVAHQFLP